MELRHFLAPKGAENVSGQSKEVDKGCLSLYSSVFKAENVSGQSKEVDDLKTPETRNED